MRGTGRAIVLVLLVLAAEACAGREGARIASPRQLNEKTSYGQGYKQIEDGITVVHLQGSDAEMMEQQAHLLQAETAAFNDVIRRNRFLQDVVRGGCTNFAAFGPTTADRKLWHGRTFDFYGLGAMDRYKVVYIVEPEGKIPYVTIGWAGWNGYRWVHTAMNASGISLGYMWADSLQEKISAAPALWELFRQVIENARTLSEAVAIIEQNPRASAANLLITDAKIPDAVVVEMTSRNIAMRRAADHAVLSTNHFLSPAMREPVKDPNSIARYMRLGELLRAEAGRVDLRTSVSFLRDHSDPLTQRRSLSGNVIAWNIGVLAVVFAPSDLRFWVARGVAPAVFSAFVGFSLRDELAGAQAATQLPTVPDDPVVTTPVYHGLMAYQAGYVAAMEGDYEEAIRKFSEAIPSDPQSGRYRFSLARAYFNAGRYPEAIRAFQDALATDMNEVLRAHSYFSLGRIYEASGNAAKMRKAFQQVLALAIGDPEIETYARRALAVRK